MKTKDDGLLDEYVKMLEGRKDVTIKRNDIEERWENHSLVAYLLTLMTPMERVFGGTKPFYDYPLKCCPICGENNLLKLEVLMYRYSIAQDFKLTFKEKFSLNRIYLHCGNSNCDADSRYSENLRALTYKLHQSDLEKFNVEELLRVEALRIGRGIENLNCPLSLDSPESNETRDEIVCPFCGSRKLDLFEERMEKRAITSNGSLGPADCFTLSAVYVECQRCQRNSKESKELRAVALNLYYEIFCFGGWK